MTLVQFEGVPSIHDTWREKVQQADVNEQKSEVMVCSSKTVG